MNIYSCKEMDNYIIKSEFKYTSDIFIVPENMYIRVLRTDNSTVTKPYNVVNLYSVQSDELICWNYGTYIKNSIDAKTFYTQFKVFRFLKETHSDFLDILLNEILNNDLSTLAIKSEHLL